MNRLSKEKSPYLLQHAENPVDWYPWGEEAFAQARRQDKPIFLSIGYSTCHWCHVMAHESFEDKRIAELINKNFIPVKVDREERPDIDQAYMSAVQAIAGQGGWPLTVILTPDKLPFFGGTYFPPEPRWGSPGIVDLILSINNVWQNDRSKINDSAQQLTDLLNNRSQRENSPARLHEQVAQGAFDQFKNSFDSVNGGFSGAPKFPTAHNLSFLLRYSNGEGSDEALRMADVTLRKMAQGGIYDHLGGGFHRYSTDPIWQVPHFEKMLYDQALISRAYLEAYQITKDASFRRTIEETFEYVLRDLTGKEGAFYSAEDADSLDPDEKDPAHAKEGSYYIWRYDELDAYLDPKQADIFRFCYGFEKNGNARSDPHGEFTGKNIVFQAKTVKEASDKFQLSEAEVSNSLKTAKQKLLQARGGRPKPHRDDKILTDWNGLMIASLAYGSSVLQEERYLQAAKKAADFILAELVAKDGRLLHRYRDGESSIEAMACDYAFFVYGALELYEASLDVKYLKEALRLAEMMVELFWDKKEGGFFYTAEGAEKLLFRQKEIYDGALPSANSIAAHNCLRLYRYTLQGKWKDMAVRSFEIFASDVLKWPSAYTQMLIAYDLYQRPFQEIVISSHARDAQAESALKLIHSFFLPGKVIILRTDANDEEISSVSPFLKDKLPLNGKTCFYVCEGHTCRLPTDSLESLKNMLFIKTDEVKK